MKNVQEVEFLTFLIVSNKYLKSYNPKQESKHTYLDAKFLPRRGFKRIDPKGFDLNKYTSNSSKGHVLEVDLEHPKELRKLSNDYPLAPDKTLIKRKILSDYQLKIADLYVKKLVPNIFDKKRTYLTLGLKLTK